jgi:hypothetical protein
MEESIWSRKDIISQPYWTFQVLHPPAHCSSFICSSTVWIIQHENGKFFTNVAEGIRCGRRLVRCLPRSGMRKSVNQGRAEETGEKRVGTWKEEKIFRKEEKERRNETGYHQKESIRRN